MIWFVYIGAASIALAAFLMCVWEEQAPAIPPPLWIKPPLD